MSTLWLAILISNDGEGNETLNNLKTIPKSRYFS